MTATKERPTIGRSTFDWKDGTPSVFMSNPYFYRKSNAPIEPALPVTFSTKRNETTKLIHELRPRTRARGEV